MNPLDALLQNDPAAFRDNVHDLLMQKLGDRLELERINVANNLFAEGDEESDPDESDEDDSGFVDDEDSDDFFSNDEDEE